MKAVPRVYLNFSANTRESTLLQLANNVAVNMLKNSALFTESILTVRTEVEFWAKEFQTSVEQASSGDKVKIQQKNVVKVNLASKLKELGRLVNLNYKGNLPILEASGFEVMTQPKKHELKPITQVVVDNKSAPGKLVVKVTGGGSNKALLFLYAESLEMLEDRPRFFVLNSNDEEIGSFTSKSQIYYKVSAYAKNKVYSSKVAVVSIQ